MNQHYQPMLCPHCQTRLHPEATFCPKCGTKITNSTVPKKNSVPLAMIIALIAVIIICVTFLLLMFLGSSDEKADVNPSQSIQTAETPLPTQIPATETPTSTYIPVHTSTPAITPQPTTETSDGYNFGLNPYGLNQSPTYTKISNSSYSFYCYVPTHFTCTSSTLPMVYHAPDNSAKMEIDAYYNSYNMSVQEAMNSYISLIGGTVKYSANGDTWFALSIQKDGVDYYIKCFVDHYIRYFTFSFPDQYLDTYELYINYIEDNFKRTDV